MYKQNNNISFFNYTSAKRKLQSPTTLSSKSRKNAQSCVTMCEEANLSVRKL